MMSAKTSITMMKGTRIVVSSSGVVPMASCAAQWKRMVR
jgi:hypothetical protein